MIVTLYRLWKESWRDVRANNIMCKSGGFPWFVLLPEDRVLGIYGTKERKLFDEVRKSTMLEF